MPLLKPKQKTNRTQLRIAFSEVIVDEIKAYCQWVGVDKVDNFLEEASMYVLSRDKDWLLEKEKSGSE